MTVILHELTSEVIANGGAVAELGCVTIGSGLAIRGSRGVDPTGLIVLKLEISRNRA